MAKKMFKNIIINLVSVLPPVKKILTEKQGMHLQIQEQANQQRALENINTDLLSELDILKEFIVPQVKFISHQLDMTGAPRIFMDICIEFKQAHPKIPVEFHTYPVAHPDNIAVLKDAGINVIVHDSRTKAPVFVRGDVVMLNSSSHSTELKSAVYEAVRKGIVRKLVWFLHEDTPELFLTAEDKRIVKGMLDAKKAVIYTAASRAKADIERFFGDSVHINEQSYKLIFPKKYHRQITAPEFMKLSFVLVGLASNGNKGQLPILYSFIEFKRKYYDKNPGQYRKFELCYVGIADSDFMSRQVLNHAGALESHFKYYPPVTHDDALDIIKASNMMICYSVTECLPIFVYEGMIMGHPILRNDCSGMAEQLEYGQNGFYLDTKDFGQIVQVLETVLNKEKTSNEKLAEMSKRAYAKAKLQEKINYEPIIKDLVEEFST